MEKTKYDKLEEFILKKGEKGVIIAFSGGVDSSTLAAICLKILGEKAVAVTAKSETYSSNELEDAKKIAKEIGIKHYFVDEHSLSNQNFINNPLDRCYYCKKELLIRLKEFADELGFKNVFEGTNFSDLKGHRPGFEAIKELDNVYSPFVENEVTKKEIRQLAKKMGITIHDKPSLACLASRISFGEKITKEKLARVEQAEQIIRKNIGVHQIRVRDHNNLARIEIEKKEIKLLFNEEKINKITKKLKKLGYKYITLDLEGYRTGSMLN